jgi:hypothetical protein
VKENRRSPKTHWFDKTEFDGELIDVSFAMIVRIAN